MADMLENAATLAKQLGDHLVSQGSTSEMKAIGANISSTASKLSTEIQSRRSTRRNTSTKTILPAGLSAMNVLLAQKKADVKRGMNSALETAAKKGMETAAATESITAAAKNPLMSLRKGIMTRLPNITGGGRRRTHRRVR